MPRQPTSTPSSTSRASVEVIDVDDIDEITPVVPKSPPQTDEQEIHDELSQPYVDIHSLFTYYNRKHFNNRITQTYVEYSSRMTLCAGTCTFKGRLGGCRIALSEPLLKFRPRHDLLSTLLHEMIHAFLFLTEGVAARDGPDGHGPKFMSHATRINAAERGRVNITPYHTFQDEVDLYRVHHWQCQKCDRLIKRAMNRAPAPRDPFWPEHQRRCGGEFVKIKEPEKKKVVKRKPKNRAVAVNPKEKVQVPKGVMRTQRVDVLLSGMKRGKMVPCPVCNVDVVHAQLNAHLDTCLTPAIFSPTQQDDLFVPPSDEEDGGENKESGEKRGMQNDRVLNGAERRDDARGQNRTQEIGSASLNGATRHKRKKVSEQTHRKRPRSPSAVSKTLVSKPEVLEALAIDPWSVTEAEVIEILDSPMRVVKETKKERWDVKSLLGPVLKPVSNAVQNECRARRELKPLKDGDGRDVLMWEQAKRMGVTVEQVWKKVRGGGVELLRDGKMKVEGGEGRAKDCDRQNVAETVVRDDDVVEIGTEQHVGRQNPPASEAQPAHRAPRESKQQTTMETGKCPVCDIAVSREELEGHVNRCLDESNVIIFDSQPSSPSPRCPLCDISVPRDELEAHVNSCMVSAGLEDAF